MAEKERLARARMAPTRISILDLLSIDAGRMLSPAEMAVELQADPGNVGYHVRVLEIVGFLELAGEQLGEGTYERFYRLTDRLPPDPSARSN